MTDQVVDRVEVAGEVVVHDDLALAFDARTVQLLIQTLVDDATLKPLLDESEELLDVVLLGGVHRRHPIGRLDLDIARTRDHRRVVDGLLGDPVADAVQPHVLEQIGLVHDPGSRLALAGVVRVLLGRHRPHQIVPLPVLRWSVVSVVHDHQRDTVRLGQVDLPLVHQRDLSVDPLLVLGLRIEELKGVQLHEEIVAEGVEVSTHQLVLELIVPSDNGFRHECQPAAIGGPETFAEVLHVRPVDDGAVVVVLGVGD